MAPRRSSRIFAAILLCAGLAHVAAQSGRTPQKPLRTLTTALEAHNLPLEEAARAYPVHLIAVATYYDPYIDRRHIALFVHDSSGSVFIRVASPLQARIHVGSLLEITGVSAAADFAPVVDEAGIRVIGESTLPRDAPRASLAQLATSKYDGQWVEVEGVVRSFRVIGQDVNLDVATSDGSLIATLVRQDGADYAALVDATVAIRANAAPVFNGNKQMVGARLLIPSLAQVRIEEPATTDPFSLPVIQVDHLLRYSPNVTIRHRVHVRGRLSLQWPGRSLCIQDASSGLCVQTDQTTILEDGALVDLVGFPVIAGLTPTLTEALFRPVERGRPVDPAPVSADEALHGNHDSKLVRIEGTLIVNDRAAKDPTMVLSSGKFLFQVILPDRSWGGDVPQWEEGSALRVTGICSVEVEASKTLREGLPAPVSFRILLRSPRDVVVTRTPSWWTARHLLPVLAAVLGIALCVLGWVVRLKHRIAEQTTLIQEQNETLRSLSFQDALTGIANRRNFDQTLEMTLQRASRSSTSVSLLIADIDHFKELNDLCGHQRGDECLVRIAHTLASSTLRSSDLVARYGGEEFAVILTGCGEEGAFAVAERMRAAVLDLAIPHPGSPPGHRVSISVGVATIHPAHGASPAPLIWMADWALYQSKLLGRNRTTAAPREGTEARSNLTPSSV